MGLLFNLVTLPVSGPLKATAWIAQQVLEAAEREYYDEEAIRRAIQELETRHQMGQIGDEEFESTADVLLERLMAARAYRAEHAQSR